MRIDWNLTKKLKADWKEFRDLGNSRRLFFFFFSLSLPNRTLWPVAFCVLRFFFDRWPNQKTKSPNYLLQSADLSTIIQSSFFREDKSGFGFGALTCKDNVARALLLQGIIGCGMGCFSLRGLSPLWFCHVGNLDKKEELDGSGDFAFF